MRTQADSSTIGVSCGHRVPRVKPPDREQLAGYWCEQCGTYRMSGGKTTGHNGHAYLLALRELVETNTRPIVVDDPQTEHGREAILALGARLRSVS